MKTTFEDFEKTTLYTNLIMSYLDYYEIQTSVEGCRAATENFHLAIRTAFLVGHQLGLDEARAILNGEKDKENVYGDNDPF